MMFCKKMNKFYRILFFNSNINRFLLQRDSNQVLRLLGGGGAEQHRLPLLRQQLHDLLHLLLEPNVKDSIRLVDDEALQVLVQEVLGVLEVV